LRFNSSANGGLWFRAKEELPHEYTHTWQEWTHRFIDGSPLAEIRSWSLFMISLRFL
jgi:hypothetical protein